MLQIGIIGAGMIGRIHAECVDRSGSARVRWIHDIDQEKAAEVAAQCRAETAVSADAVFESAETDAVIIAASTDSHGRLARDCAAAGKPFLLEKPIDVALESSIETVKAVRAAGVFAGLGFSRRYDRQHAALRNSVAEGAIGRIEMMRFTSRTQALPDLGYISSSGGQLRDKGSHFFDLVCWISGERPREIFAVGECLVEPRFAEFGDCDTAMLTLRMPGGAICGFDFGRRTAYGYDESIEVFGSEGRIDSRAPSPFDIVHYQGTKAIHTGLHQVWIDRFRDCYFHEIQAFLGELVAPTGVFPSLEDGLVAECTASAGLLSMQNNRPESIDYVQLD